LTGSMGKGKDGRRRKKEIEEVGRRRKVGKRR
jgi:hypothetical protein